MQTSLVVLLIAMAMFAVVCYRIGFMKPVEPFNWLSQAGFVVLAFLLIPSVLFVLWGQAGAKKGLAEIGIHPFPELTEASGIATGIAVEGSRVWVFHTDANAEAAIDFYRDPETRPGWQLRGESPMMLILQRGAQRLTISASESRSETVVIYALHEEAEGGPGPDEAASQQ